MIFKVIVLGLLAWQLIELLRKRKEKTQPTYIFATTEKPLEKEAERSAPPAYYESI